MAVPEAGGQGVIVIRENAALGWFLRALIYSLRIDYGFSASRANCSAPSTTLENHLNSVLAKLPQPRVDQIVRALLSKLQSSDHWLSVPTGRVRARKVLGDCIRDSAAEHLVQHMNVSSWSN